MKKLLIIGGIALGVLLVLFLTIPIFLPSTWHVSRERVIQAPPERVFDLVNDLEKLTTWSPWKEADPTMEYEFSDPPAGLDAWYRWSSKDSGKGKMTIVESVRPELLRMDLDFEDGKMSATNRFLFESVGTATRVTWITEGDDGGHLVHRWFLGLMETMVRFYCDRGLELLAEVAEKPAVETPAVE